MNVASSKLALWDAFCRSHQVIERSAPLFELTDRGVAIRPYGRDRRRLLQRSPEMDTLVIQETSKVLRDFDAAHGAYDGLIYMMFWESDAHVLPLYVGKSEKFGRRGGNLSANIADITSNLGKFARWGYGYAYHVGDLSAVVVPGHPAATITRKYMKWAERLFEAWPSDEPRLRHDTRFWIEAWSHDSVGIWQEYGATSLTFLEYLLIGVASDLFPGYLLNDEGVNRR